MSSHRARPAARRTKRSGRARALMSLGAVGFLALGLGAQGTFAFWSDKATVTTGSFTSGTLDIVLDNELGLTGGPGTDAGNGFTKQTFTMPDAYPGESVAYSFPVKNNGNAPLTYTLAATGTGPLAVANGMQYRVFFGTAVPNSVPQNNTDATPTAPRTGTCGTQTAIDTNSTALIAGSAAATFPDSVNRTLAVGATEQVCIIARFSSAAGNSLQNLKTPITTASFVFTAKQLGAP